MHFGLSEEQELLQETVRGFAAGECPPDRMRQVFDDGSGFDAELWRGLTEIGVSGLAIAEEYGGAGMEWLDLALVSEVLGSYGLPVPLIGHSLAAYAIQRGGSAEQKERWLPALASGERIGAVALADEGDGWEPESWSAVAWNDRELTGRKRFATDVDVASLFVVGTTGGELAVVERDASGLETERVGSIDHTRQVGDLVLEATPAELLGGAALAKKVRDGGLALLAADAFGAASKLVDITVEYAKTRQQFGQEIGQFQAVKHQLADMATQLECARGLYWYAAHSFDHAESEGMRMAAIAKSHLTDLAAWIGRESIELHGGLGFTWECDVHIHMKRTMFDRAFLGTPEHHRRRIAQQEGW
jgi:alkylation response protein AidB-like acyl-CoA dehydrogenase